MTNYSIGQYTNLYPYANVNAFPEGWGAWQYPGGVPNSLLGNVHFDFGSTSLTVTVRRELVVLTGLSFQIAKMHGYTVYGYPNPGGEATWGPWGYENRTISGSSQPSNHSKGRAMDWNAPWNPYTTPIISNIPPALVLDMQRLGWYWGGFYGDSMHFEYIGSMYEVGAKEDLARSILGQNAPPPAGGGGGGGPITPPKPTNKIPKAHAIAGVWSNNSAAGWRKPAWPQRLAASSTWLGEGWTEEKRQLNGAGDWAAQSWIKLVQNYLRSIGYLPNVPSDGLFGPRTANAVKRFQQNYVRSDGFTLRVTGDVRKADWQAMSLRYPVRKIR